MCPANQSLFSGVKYTIYIYVYVYILALHSFEKTELGCRFGFIIVLVLGVLLRVDCMF